MFLVGYIVLCAVVFHGTESANCAGEWTPSATTTNTDNDDSDQNRLYVGGNTNYQISCTCGSISRWRFYARRAGTLILFVVKLDGGQYEVVGTNSINVPALSRDNHFDVPISEGLRIEVTDTSTYYLGWWTSSDEMITYNTNTASDNNYYTTVTSVSVGDTFTFTNQRNDRMYAVAAYVEANRPPMFLNAPYHFTQYSHVTGTILTLSVTDFDSSPTLISTSVPGGFSYSTGTQVLSYDTAQADGSYTISFSLSDLCNTVTADVTVILINKPPILTNLPAWTSLAEGSSSSSFFTVTYTDDLDTVTCSISPAVGGVSISVSGNALTYNGQAFSTSKWIKVPLSCSDGKTAIQSSYTIDVTQNTKPSFTNLPASTSVNPTTSGVFYTVAATDTDGLTYGMTTTGVPFSIDTSSGAITATPTITSAGYDLTITVNDGTNTVTSVLSVLNTGTPRQNTAPVFTNIPATINMVEGTAAGTYLYVVGYSDADQSDTLTLSHSFSDADMSTYFSVDDSTGVVTVLALVDFENPTFANSGSYIRFTISDGTDQSIQDLTIEVNNVNESPSFDLASYTASIDEGVADRAATLSSAIATSDIDASFTHTIKLDCGTNSKYFYYSSNQVYLAQAWDADASGVTNSATCTLTVTDEGGLIATASLALTINNVNDHNPEFRYDTFIFFVLPSASFFTSIGNISATDDDSDTFGSTNGAMTYSFLDSGDTYFMADATGLLFVNDVSSFSTGSYTSFRFVATDAGGFSTTCTVSIIFSGVQTTTAAPTTERTYSFHTEAKNYTWITVLGVLVVGILILSCVILVNDPALRDRVADWRRRMRVKEPKLDKATREMKEYLSEKRRKKEENERKKEEKRRKKDPAYGLPWELLATKTTEDVIEEDESKKDDGKKKKDKSKDKDKKSNSKKSGTTQALISPPPPAKPATPKRTQDPRETPNRTQGPDRKQSVTGKQTSEQNAESANIADVTDEVLSEDAADRHVEAPLFETSNAKEKKSQDSETAADRLPMDF